MANADDPLVRMIRDKAGRGRKHGLIKEGALDDAEGRNFIEGEVANAGPDHTFEIVKMRKGYTPDSHGHVHTHNAGTDQEYDHDHGHDHIGGLHADGKVGDHQHGHIGVKAAMAKGSIVAGEALAGQRGPGPKPNVTSPSGASAGVCGNGSCSCGDCGPACTGSCCEDCTMVANTSSQRVNEQAEEAQRGWKIAELTKRAKDMREIADGSRDFHVRMQAKAAEESALAEIRQLSISAELAELRKGARSPRARREPARSVPFVTKRVNPELTKKLKALDPVLALADEIVKLTPFVEHPDYKVREGARELIAQKRAAIENFGRVDVQKAYIASNGLSAEQIGRLVRAAVDKGMSNLNRQFEDLNRR